ncbi:hypothetical protein NECAME_03436 [Necator americanus]|uniref:Uncharacterized protein n=1 Tax=Necator americanus TaxID=51031 RepID=W2T4K0_NECAM|nr:hypothetical protein NECAME_03436 [Necator americanus]ETN76504.1 hypothetical protein NECAME_03436 [Necator americanus]
MSYTTVFWAFSNISHSSHEMSNAAIVPCSSLKVFLILFLIIVAIVVAILLLFGAYRGIRNLLGVYDYHMSDDSTFLLGIMIIVIYLFVAILEIFFLIIVWKLYKHLRDYSSIDHYYADDKNVQWTTIGLPPKDNAHGSPTMGDVYPYGQQQQGNML